MKLWFYCKLYIFTLIIFLLLDSLWISVIANKFYKEQIGYLLSSTPNLPAAALFYCLYIVGLLIFVVGPSLKSKSKSVVQVAFLGGLFGLFAYCTYDLTNFATIKDWPLQLTLVDILWGYILSGVVSAASYLLGKKLS